LGLQARFNATAGRQLHVEGRRQAQIESIALQPVGASAAFRAWLFEEVGAAG